jgi:vitamin B12 transporter
MRNFWPLCAALPAICLGSDTEPLGEVIVTATRTATPAAHLAVPVTVISRDELEHSAPLDAADALAGHAGVEVARTGGPGQPASLFIRGTNSNHSVVLVDGVRINPGTLGGAALQNILPDSIERIEIVRGARSALWGTDAIGGVVNIITRGGNARQPSATLSAGSYDTRLAAVDAGAALGANAGIGGSFARQTSAGFAPLADDPRRRGYRNSSGNLAGYFKPTDAWRFELAGWNAAGVSEYLGYDDNFNFGPLSAAFHNAAWALTATQSAPQYRWQTRLSRATDELDQREFSDFAHTRRDSAESLLTVPLARQQLMAGAEFAREATVSASFGTHYDVTTRSQRYFAQDQITAGDNDILLAVGRTQQHDFGGHTSWNAEWNRRLHQRWRLTAALGSAYHAPDSTVRYGFGGNPALRPERSSQAEAGLHWQPSATQELALNVFDTRVRDLIVVELTDPFAFTFEAHNVERARIRGAELQWNATVSAWRFDAGATLQDPRNDTTGERLARRAHAHMDLRAAWQQGRFHADAAVLVSGSRGDVSFPASVLLPGYTLVNGSFGYRLGRDWSLQARVDNVLDRRYQLVYGYNTPRRNFLLTARYRGH